MNSLFVNYFHGLLLSMYKQFIFLFLSGEFLILCVCALMCIRNYLKVHKKDIFQHQIYMILKCLWVFCFSFIVRASLELLRIQILTY